MLAARTAIAKVVKVPKLLNTLQVLRARFAPMAYNGAYLTPADCRGPCNQNEFLQRFVYSDDLHLPIS